MDSIETIDLTREELELELANLFPPENVETQEEPTPEPIEEEVTTVLPRNSPTLLVGEETSRFSSAEWYDLIRESSITVAGLGGIGSYVAFLIGRMHPCQLVLYDGDIVEAANMSGQLYGTSYIGIEKTASIASIIREFSSFYSFACFRMLTNESIITPILICGFDNMYARRLAFSKWKALVQEETEESKNKFLFIDGRLAAEEFQVFCMTGKDNYLMQKYENEWLFSDDEAEQTICSYKQTSYCANMIGSIMVNLLVNFITNLSNPLIPRELPFMTRYDATTMMFKTE